MEVLVGKTAPVHDGTGQKNRRRQRKKPARERSLKRNSTPGRFSPCVIVHLSGRSGRKNDVGQSAA